ncbi:MAG: DNA repair protein RecN [Planctomycetota bacterium]
MLHRLQIQNLAIIDALTLDFSEGFTVLTGETGAGKSIIIGALNLILGERASSDDVRTGCDSATVEALFDISALDRVRECMVALNLPLAGGELVIRREISAQGRSRCLVNGCLVPLGQLRSIGDLLVDLHGQHQHQSLLKVELHREILDLFGGTPIRNALETYRELYARHSHVLSCLKNLDRDEREKARLEGLLEYQVKEINDAGLEPGEEETWIEESRRLKHADVLLGNTLSANDLLHEGEVESATVTSLLSRCAALITEAAHLDPSLEELRTRIESALSEIEDIASQVRSYSSEIEHNPQRLEEVEDRLHLIHKLKAKYGTTIQEILTERDRFEQELHALTHSREEQERLEREAAELEKEMAGAAETLSGLRRKFGDIFSDGLRAHLKELEMPSTRFQVRLVREAVLEGRAALDEDGDTPALSERAILFPDGKRYHVYDSGVDRVEFMISPNPGEALKPLRKIASGGELSRIMLALKLLMRSMDKIPTLVFDEIDTGISGHTGARIGDKMIQLGKEYQVICITHLPQIASKAAYHLAVTKVRQKQRTLTRVVRLDHEQRLQEIARLLGGKTDSSIALSHAQELLQE